MDFPDRRFRRQLVSGESVNVNLAAAGASGGSCQCLQFIQHFIGIVRKRIEVAALNDNCVGIAIRSGLGREIQQPNAQVSESQFVKEIQMYKLGRNWRFAR